MEGQCNGFAMFAVPAEMLRHNRPRPFLLASVSRIMAEWGVKESCAVQMGVKGPVALAKQGGWHKACEMLWPLLADLLDVLNGLLIHEKLLIYSMLCWPGGHWGFIVQVKHGSHGPAHLMGWVIDCGTAAGNSISICTYETASILVLISGEWMQDTRRTRCSSSLCIIFGKSTFDLLVAL